MGIRRDGTRKVLDFELAASESEVSWSGVCKRLRERGLKGNPLKLIIHDGADGLIEALSSIWPYAKRQTCAVHPMRNLSKRIQRRDRKPLLKRSKSH